MERGKKLKLTLMVFLFIALPGICAVSKAKIIYVDDNANGVNDGSSWENAYTYLQDALAEANTAEKPIEIRVAQGIYKPDQGVGKTLGDREASFRLINGVTISGGYAGLTEPEPNERNYGKYETILSGDLAGNDVDVSDPDDLLNEPSRSENSYRILKGFNVNETSVLDGFTITGGKANGWQISLGGGIYLDSDGNDGPFISNCIFINNYAGSQGGAIYSERCDGVLLNCIFRNNYAGGRGGAISSGGYFKAENCTFINNQAGSGGGIFIYMSSPSLKNCEFINNSAVNGGAVETLLSGPKFNSCTFKFNNAEKGGGIYNEVGIIRLNNVTVCKNSAEEGGGIYNIHTALTSRNCTFNGNYADKGKAIWADHYYGTKIFNSILWDGENQIWNDHGGKITIAYSNIQTGQAGIYYPEAELDWGSGNIDTDPLFADLNNCDYHLKSQAGRWNLNSQSWVQDDVTSPCIDAGNPLSPIGLEPFPNGGRINMGVYGGTAEASKAYFGEPLCETIIAGDINGDCIVDFNDMKILLLHWLEIAEPEPEYVVEVTTSTDKPVYTFGERITISINAYNPTPYPVTMELGTDYEASYLLDGIYRVGRSTDFDVSTHRTIEPYNSYTWNFEHNTDSSYYPLTIGTHKVIGEVDGYGVSEEIEFEVISE